MDYRTKYPRLRFTDGDRLDLDHAVPPWDMEVYEAEWRAVGVRVEWLLSPRGRLDAALRYVAPDVEKSTGPLPF